MVLHLQVYYRWYGAEFDECGPTEDTLVQGWAVDHQELNLNGSGHFGYPKGDHEFYETLRLSDGPVEAL